MSRHYALLTCGASFGDAYGPMLVAKTPIRPSEVEGMKVALPGALTTAALVARLWFGRTKIDARQVPFDKIMDVVRAGLVRAGVIIHEGQLTYKEHGLVRVVDFGQWWSDQTEGLPLPLGGNGIRRDIPADLAAKIALDLKRSIAYALGHREEALAYAMKFGRNLRRTRPTSCGHVRNDHVDWQAAASARTSTARWTRRSCPNWSGRVHRLTSPAASSVRPSPPPTGVGRPVRSVSSELVLAPASRPVRDESGRGVRGWQRRLRGGWTAARILRYRAAARARTGCRRGRSPARWSDVRAPVVVQTRAPAHDALSFASSLGGARPWRPRRRA
jgi:hypothetical protein